MLAKAKLVEIKWDAKQQTATKVNGQNDVQVQFNPQSLKLTYANENKGGDQPGGSAKQFVGSGTSKLAVDLLFDTTDSGSDVRKQSQQVAYFIQAQPQRDKKNVRVPPGISFEWGSFIFRGVMDSLQETLDYFSEEGVPLRATLSLGISRQDIEFQFGSATAAAGGLRGPAAGAGTPGTQPMQAAQAGDSVQKMAGRNGNSADWKSIAAANNIDDPLRLNAGALLNLNVSAGVSLNAGASAGGTEGGEAGFSAGLGGGVGFSGSANLGAGLNIGASLSAGGPGGAGASFGIGASVDVAEG